MSLDKVVEGLQGQPHATWRMATQVLADLCLRQDVLHAATIHRVSTHAAGLKLNGENPYGNETAIFTRDYDLAQRFGVNVRLLEINVPIPVPVTFYSFGNSRASSCQQGRIS